MNDLNMKMYKVFLRVILFVTVLTQSINTAQAQNGDQILDGIGETGMIARYVFDGDGKDWSRNNLHAKFQSSAVKFVKMSVSERFYLFPVTAIHSLRFRELL